MSFSLTIISNIPTELLPNSPPQLDKSRKPIRRLATLHNSHPKRNRKPTKSRRSIRFPSMDNDTFINLALHKTLQIPRTPLAPAHPTPIPPHTTSMSNNNRLRRGQQLDLGNQYIPFRCQPWIYLRLRICSRSPYSLYLHNSRATNSK